MPKKCPRCGTSCGDAQAFCPRCGTKLPAAQPSYGQRPPPGPQRPQGRSPYGPGPQPPYGQQSYVGMGWFKFLIYFWLFAFGIAYILFGIAMLAGNGHYESVYGVAVNVSSLYYYSFPSLKIVDIIYGIFLILVGGDAIFARMQLAAYRAYGIKHLKNTLTTAIAVNVIYMVVAAIIFGGMTEYLSAFFATPVSMVIVVVIILAINSSYFRKRAYMFS